MGLYRRSESAVWWMSYTLNGTQHRVSSGTTDKEQAKRQLLAALLQDVFSGANTQVVDGAIWYRRLPKHFV